MTRSIRFRAEAEVDLQVAYDWYEQQRSDLGADFLLCVEEALHRLRQNPELHGFVYKSVRQALVRRFPFAIYYRILDSAVDVLAVFHARRDPRGWQSRTEP